MVSSSVQAPVEIDCETVVADLKENGPEVLKEELKNEGDPEVSVIASYGTEAGAQALVDQLLAAARDDPLCLNNYE